MSPFHGAEDKTHGQGLLLLNLFKSTRHIDKKTQRSVPYFVNEQDFLRKEGVMKEQALGSKARLIKA